MSLIPSSLVNLLTGIWAAFKEYIYFFSSPSPHLGTLKNVYDDFYNDFIEFVVKVFNFL